MVEFKILSNPSEIYSQMLKDIKSAKKSIYLETYIYDSDKIGDEFRRILTKKAKQGVKIFLLIDSWGSSINKKYFTDFKESGGKFRFFRELRYVFGIIRSFNKNHERNHRKLLIIDKKISYTGSINITAKCLGWRELVLRLEGDISESFYNSFIKSWNLFNKLKNLKKIKPFIYKKFKIIHDAPNHKRKKTHSNYIKLINNAKKEIKIETPYFVPTPKIVNALSNAVKRKVDVKIILPKVSDVRLTDILRRLYLGKLHKKGVKIYFYPKVLHSKLLIIDDNFFLLGSSNLDYRSFIHQYEINLLGEDKEIIKRLKKYFKETLFQTNEFDYVEWQNRGIIKKIHERFLRFVEWWA